MRDAGSIILSRTSSVYILAVEYAPFTRSSLLLSVGSLSDPVPESSPADASCCVWDRLASDPKTPVPDENGLSSLRLCGKGGLQILASKEVW